MSELVSIILPIYNVEQYLDNCIQSVVNQTYKNLEIILVDDGSTDGSPEICDSWAKKDGRIKVIHKQNAGAGMARNTGLDNATGKYIGLFDSDDHIELCLVEKCLESFSEHASDVVVFRYSNVDAEGNITYKDIKPSVLSYSGDRVKTEFLPSLFSYKLGFGVGCCKMYKLDLINDHHIRYRSEREMISEDAYFALEVFTKAKKVSLVPQSLYYYHRRDASLTHTYNPDRPVRNNTFLKQSVEYAKDNALPEEVSIHIMARYHAMVLGTLMQIVRSDLKKAEKRAEINRIFTDEILQQTLSKEVCMLDARLPRVFWASLRHEHYLFCRFLLWLNSFK